MEPTEENIRAWEEAHRRGAPARPGLPPVVRDWLPELDGRHVLHLMCGSGEATAELVARGALVTAVDPAADVLAPARQNVPTAAFVQAGPQELPPELLRGRFQLVYAARGTLARLRDLDAWAHAVARALRPHAYLLLHDEHPVARCVDPLLHWRGGYFDAPTLGGVLTALGQAGFVLRRLGEWAGEEPRLPLEFVLVARKP